MPYDSNGNYTLPAIYKATPGTVIMTEQHNFPFEDVQAALNKVFLRDGSAPFLANLNANGFRITGLAAGAQDTDAVNVAQLNGLLSSTALTGNSTAENLTITGSAIVPAVGDWTTYQAVGAKDADARYVSGIRSMSPGDSPGIALFYSQSGSGPWFVSGPWVGRLTMKSELDTVASYAVSTNSTANQALNIANQKVASDNGEANNLSINYGGMRAQFQTDGNLALYQGSNAVFSVSINSIQWNGHSFAFIDNLPLDASKKIEAFSVSSTDGAWVTFPSAFSAKPDAINITCQRSNNRCVIASYEGETNTGFTLGMQREDTNGATQQTSPWTIHVTAIGNR